MTTLLTSKEAQELLNIKDRRVIGWLVERNLLPRIAYGPRTFRYQKEDCERLIEMAKEQGITLTAKP